jgi:hypothetical protein
MVAAFTDGYLRFFELRKSKSLGRCTVADDDSVCGMKLLPSGQHMIVATRLGLILVIFIERWEPLAVRIHSVRPHCLKFRWLMLMEVSVHSQYHQVNLTTNG